jgi:FtsP/CotA-like multicopper oxidase with cupredoxin domain
VICTLAFALASVALLLQSQNAPPTAVRLQADELPDAVANDNRVAAGRRIGDTVVVRLVVRRAIWRLDGDSDPGIPLLAFAEEGGPARVPGPLLRARAGTVVVASVRNPLARDTLVVYGLTARESADSLVVPPGVTATTRFAASREGTYYYWGTTHHSPLRDRFGDDSNLSAAFVVDPAGTAGPPRDRIFVLTEHGAKPSDVPGIRGPVWTAINGKSWPHTERLTYPLGDSIRWRVVNVSSSPHPMHLHGAYYRIDAKAGDGVDTLYAPDQRRMAVTERVLPGQTMRLTWSPGRPGGWLFHCHAVMHVGPHPPVDGSSVTHATHADADPDQHTFSGMSGLVVAVSVPVPAGYVVPPVTEWRRLRLLVNSDSLPGDHSRRFGFVLQDGERASPADSVPVPGPTIVLTRGEPTAIEVVNRTPEPTSVHWHGIELESYFDGVTGVTGLPGRTTPAIRPGGRFEARMTPPRAGTFIYHTHFSELRQYTGGLTGALVVLEPGERWDPERDRVFLFGDARERAGNIINGSTSPAPIELRAGTPYRFRLINIAVGRPAAVIRLTRDGQPVAWRALAKDGWTLDSAHATSRPSVQPLGTGETADFEFIPDRAGDLRLEFRAGGTGYLFITAPVRVR